MASGYGLILADSLALLRGYEDVEEKLEEDLKGEHGLDVQVYAKGGLRFAPRYGRKYTYEAVLEGILKDWAGQPEYVVLLSGGNDMYEYAHKTLTEQYEQYENVRIALAITSVAARLWYQRIPSLIVVGGSSEVFQYTGNKAVVYDRRAQMVRSVAQRMMAAVPLGGCSLVSGIGFYYGGAAAYTKFLHALSIFAFTARFVGLSRL